MKTKKPGDLKPGEAIEMGAGEDYHALTVEKVSLPYFATAQVYVHVRELLFPLVIPFNADVEVYDT